jgi:hypothetical protein
MTAIFEYALPDAMSPEGWAQAWHALGRHPAFDESFRADLQALTDRFVSRGVSPARVNGSALSQVRTNESAFNWIWQLREFRLTAAGDLALAPVSNTPGETLNDSSTLHDFVTANVDAVRNDKMVLPASMRGGSANQLLFRWEIPDVDEPTRIAFAKATCNGCHSGENTPVDTAFHVSPFRSGADKLSPFLNNPQDPAHDELARREGLLQSLLCTGK